MSKAVAEHDRVQKIIDSGNEPLVQKVIEYGINNVRADYERAEERDTSTARRQAYIDRYKNTHSIETRSGFTLFGSNYIGPLNTVPNGPPLHGPDIDAETHDKKYDTAKSHSDIQEADIHLLKEAGDHIAEGISGTGSLSDTFYSTLTGIGIGGKYAAEAVVGPIYPNTFTGKQWHHHLKRNIDIPTYTIQKRDQKI